MPIRLNLCGNSLLTPPSGYPFRLWAGTTQTAEGVLPKWVSSVTAEVAAESGTADAHMAIYAMPTTVGGSDGALVKDLDPTDATVALVTYQVDAVGVTNVSQTLTLKMPSTDTHAPTVYLVRLWADNITGQTVDTRDRDADGLTSDEPSIPSGVSVTSIKVA